MPSMEELRIILRGKDEVSPVVDQLMAKMRALRREMAEYSRKMATAETPQLRGTYRAAVERRAEEYAALERRLRRVVKPFENVESRATRVSRALNTMRNAFRKAATDMVWASLSMLGVVWSLQAVLTYTVQPLRQNIQALSDYQNAAFGVATWLAIAKRQGYEWAESLDASEEAQKMVDVGLDLKATWGSLDKVFLRFYSNLIDKYPGLKESMDTAFETLLKLAEDPEMLDKVGKFVKGIFDGIADAAPKVIDVLDRIDDFFDLGTAGKLIGWLATFMFIIAPLLATLQALFSIIQAVLKGVEIIIKAFIVLGKVGKKALEWVFGYIEEGGVAAGARNTLTGVLMRGAFPFLPVFSIPSIIAGDIFRGGPLSRIVNVNQYVNIGTVSSEVDINKLNDELVRTVGYGAYYSTAWG